MIWAPAGTIMGALLGLMVEPFGYWPADAGLGAVVGGIFGIGVAYGRGNS